VRRRALALTLLVAAAAALLVRRRSVSRGEHVDLYYDDGSMVSLEAGTPRAEEMLAAAREALARTPA
jgi:hypothetical protein